MIAVKLCKTATWGYFGHVFRYLFTGRGLEALFFGLRGVHLLGGIEDETDPFLPAAGDSDWTKGHRTDQRTHLVTHRRNRSRIRPHNCKDAATRDFSAKKN